MLELIFLLAFTFHNLEEGIWLPRRSKHAGKYHPEVSNNEFHFALIVITTVGYLLTFLFMTLGSSIVVIKYVYLGFVLMMSLNSIFPHLLATIDLKRYSPGTLSGLFLNLPIGSTIIIDSLGTATQFYKLTISFVVITIITVKSLLPLFKLGNKLKIHIE